MRIEAALRDWLNRRHEDHLLYLFGGIQQCPWCRQIVQKHKGWRFECSEVDRKLDVLTCGNCGGTSHWIFAMGMQFVESIAAPLPIARTTPRPSTESGEKGAGDIGEKS